MGHTAGMGVTGMAATNPLQYPDRSKLTISAPANAQARVSEAWEWLVQHEEHGLIMIQRFTLFVENLRRARPRSGDVLRFLVGGYLDKLGKLVSAISVQLMIDDGSPLGHTIRLREEGVGLVWLAKELLASHDMAIYGHVGATIPVICIRRKVSMSGNARKLNSGIKLVYHYIRHCYVHNAFEFHSDSSDIAIAFGYNNVMH
ncbi:hypothetical protein EV702DRAFT_1044604 [Suillus placidus]|uniref:Uncharacterized protein n=1 Tax=Suillus placidus TaxID=48579 RepID=A0A9P6ZYQ8_9AGAM|nr:hypothetical protein EV702DRAFT_1044604 [Suillus placidus]